MECLLVKVCTDGLVEGSRLVEDLAVGLGEFAVLGHSAAAVLGDHGQRTLGEVAEVVGQVGVDAVNDGLFGVGAVLAEGNLAHEEEAHSVQAEGVDEVCGVDDVTDGLGHLLAVDEQEAVAEHALGQFDSGRPQECGPVDGVESGDVLADEVQVGGPVLGEQFVVGVGVAEAGDVVGEGVDPHVHDVLVVAGYGYAPVEGGAGDGQVVEAALDEGDQFVAAGFGVDVAFVGVEFEELVAVLGEAEEVGFFFGPFDFGAGGDGVALAVAYFGFVFCVVGFVADGVPAGVLAEVDVTVLFHALPDGLGCDVVVGVGGADEAVVADVQRVVHCFEACGVLVGEFFGGLTELFGGGLHLLAVLVGAGHEAHVEAVEALEAG